MNSKLVYGVRGNSTTTAAQNIRQNDGEQVGRGPARQRRDPEFGSPDRNRREPNSDLPARPNVSGPMIGRPPDRLNIDPQEVSQAGSGGATKR